MYFKFKLNVVREALSSETITINLRGPKEAPVFSNGLLSEILEASEVETSVSVSSKDIRDLLKTHGRYKKYMYCLVQKDYLLVGFSPLKKRK